jgi:hypothetical protein
MRETQQMGVFQQPVRESSRYEQQAVSSYFKPHPLFSLQRIRKQNR